MPSVKYRGLECKIISKKGQDYRIVYTNELGEQKDVWVIRPLLTFPKFSDMVFA